MADEQAPKKKSKLKWILLLLFILILLGGAAAGAWFFFLADKLNLPSSQEQQTQKVEVPSAVPVFGKTVPLPVFTVNLSDPLGQRFIKINLEVEVANEKVAAELEQYKARIRDSIILLLSSKTYADIATVESKELLKSEVADRLNGILGVGKVYQVFITDMVIQ